MKGLIKNTRQQFEGLKDPRTPCPALRHSYTGVLAMVAVAMMFAAEGPTAVVRFWNDIAGHGPRRMERLLRALGLEKLPSHDAVGRVMAATDPDALDQAVQAGRRLMDRRGTAARPRHIAVTPRRAAAAPPRPTAWRRRWWSTPSTRTPSGYWRRWPPPGQEVPTARKLLLCQDMCLDGALGSFDAAHCCRETLSLVRRRGGDWLVPVKGNTPSLRDEIMFSLDAAAAETVTVCEKGHGRRDTRTVRVVTDPGTCECLGGNHGCDGLRTIGHIVYITEEKGKKPTREQCAFIGSRRMGARELLAEVRRHWGVEVAHNRPDVSLGADACRVRTGWGPANFAILRRFGLQWLDTLRGKDEPLPAAISRLLCGFAVAVAMEDAAMTAM
jgi:predicted transposase YbfD/YdcC